MTQHTEEASDAELMQRYVAGDTVAFSVLFRRTAPRVHAFFMRAFNDRGTCDDFLQTTFLRLHRAKESYRAGTPPLPWIIGIAAHIRIDELRRRYRLPKDAGPDALDSLVVSADERSAGEQASLVERVRSAVDSLPEGQRMIVHLHRFEGLTFREIATALELEEGAVRVRASRAYEALRQKLASVASEEGL